MKKNAIKTILISIIYVIFISNVFCQAPTISNQPSNATVCIGNNTSFSVTTTGNITSYQWQVSTDNGVTFNNITTAGSNPIYSDWNTATLALSGVINSSNGYLYRCIISGQNPTQIQLSNIGTGTWVCPVNVTSVNVECWGAGGSGGNASYAYYCSTSGGGACVSGGGGGGGAYASSTIPVSSGTSYSYFIPGCNTSTGAGVATSFNSNTVVAASGRAGTNGAGGACYGSGGIGGSAASSVGTIKYSGGDGASAYYNGSAYYPGAGGGGASSTANGANANQGTGGSITSPDGPSGASGISGNRSFIAGGSGARLCVNSTTQNGGQGGQGYIELTYYYTLVSNSASLSVNPLPIAPGTITGNTIVCKGQNSVNYNVPTITNATSYEWILPNGAIGTSTTNSITVNYGTSTTSGNITVKGVNACGQGTTSSLSITVNPTTIPTFTQVGPYCQNETPATLPTMSNNGIAGTWNPATISTETVGTATYTFTPTSLTSPTCATTATMSVTINSLTTPTFTQFGPYCQNSTPTTLPTTSNNGITGIWNAEISSEIAGAATYTFTPTSTASPTCASTATMSITVNAPTTPSFTQVSPICSGTSLATLPTTSTNGKTGSWSPVLNNTATTTYTFTPTLGQCATTASMTIVVNTTPSASVNATGATTFCQGESVVINANTGSGLTYQWQQNGIDIAGATTDSYTATIAGSYTVVVSNSSACSTTSAPTSVTVNTEIVPTFNSLASICQGATMPQLPNTSINNISGTWSPALDNSTTTTYTFTPNSGLCATSTTMTVTVDAPPTATINTNGSTALCQDESVVLSANFGSGLTYQWQQNGTDIVGAIADSYTATTAGVYTVVVSNSSACSTTSAATSITVNSNITPLFTQIAPICQGDLLQLPTISDNTISGTWSPALDNTQTTTYTFTPNAVQCATTALMTISVNPSPNATINALGATTFCLGESVILNANTDAGLIYQWQQNGMDIVGVTADNYTATTAGSYTVVVSNSSACSSISAPISVTVNSDITPLFTQIAPICQGDVLQLPTISDNSISGTWSPALDNTQTTTYTFTPNAGQCAMPTTMTVTVNTPPSAIITSTGATTFCQGGSVLLNATLGAGLSYQWQNNGTDILGATAVSYTATTTDSYTVVVTNSNGCSATSAPKSVLVSTLPDANITATGATSFCQGGSVVLNANLGSGFHYQWQYNGTNINGLGATSASYVATVAGSYTVVITNSTGCDATSQPIAVVINNGTVPTFTAVAPICQGSIFSQLPVISTNNISGTWSPAMNSTATTTYTFTPTVGQCATTATMTVTVNSAPDATVTAADVTTFCNGNSVVLNANTGSGLTYQWQQNGTDIVGATNGSYIATAAGFYRVIVTYSNSGCTKTSANTMISIIPSPNVTLAPFSNLCDTLGIFQLSGGSPAGGTYSGTSVSNSTFNTSVGVGIYPITYSYTDANGCSSSRTEDITVINCTNSGLEELHSNSCIIFPNPVRDYFSIRLYGESEEWVQIAIYDLSGKCVEHTTVSVDALETITLGAHLASGMYNVLIQSGSRMMQTKLMKQ